MRKHVEMQPIDMGVGWSQMEGFAGVEVKYLANDLDEKTMTGARTRYVRVAPGTKTPVKQVHTYWEDVFVLEGDLYPLADGCDSAPTSPHYSLRPPGTSHGPFGSQHGCLLLEVQYFLK
jgi:ChrR Cupin-like domain